MPGATRQRLKRRLGCSQRLDGPPGEGDARFVEESGHGHVRGVTGTGVAACPAKGCGCALTDGRGAVRGPEELWVRGPAPQGLRRGREMPVHQRRSPGIEVAGA